MCAVPIRFLFYPIIFKWSFIMNTKQPLLVLTLSSILVACGSGSDISSKGFPVIPNKPGTTNMDTPTVTDNDIKEKNYSIYHQDKVTTEGDLDCFEQTDCNETLGNFDGFHNYFFKDANQEDISRLNIAGEIINLRPFQNIQQENYYYKDKENNIIRAVSGKKYDSVMFGALNGKQTDPLNKSSNNISAMFLHGYKTVKDLAFVSDAIPNTGIVKYHGDAFAIKEGLKGVLKGNADFTVNFAQKAFTGKLTQFGSNIDDIQFSGNAGAVGISGFDEEKANGQRYFFSGNFYGQDASTIAGRLSGRQNDKKIEAVVGAKKQ